MVVRELKVIRKHRDDPPQDHPINFPKLLNLHLELVENKSKLKSGVPVNPIVKDIRPKKKSESSSSKQSVPSSKSSSKSSVKSSSKKHDHSERHESKKSKRSTDSKSSKSSKSSKDNDELDGLEDLEDELKVSTTKSSSKKSKSDRNKRKDVDKPDEDDMIDALGDEEEVVLKKPSDKLGKHTKSDDSKKSTAEKDVAEELLGESEEFVGDGEDGADGEGEEKEGEEEAEAEEEDDEFANMTPEEKVEYEHKEYLWRFRILKKKYKSADIPKYNQHSDIQMMKRDYERIVRELQLDDSVETYKQYLFGGFMAIELVCTQFIGINMEGFTNLQSRMMPKYERMLIELGEKSYTTWGSNLPVEIRLIGYVLLQAGIFYLAKVIATKLGDTAADLFKGFMGQPPDPIKSEPPRESDAPEKHKSKKKMKGPRINVSDLRNKSTQKDEKNDKSVKQD